MGFKHDHGRNSELYKSLEKIAFQKEWIKPQKIVKEAAPNYIPVENVEQNILNLCEALHQKGLSALASDLEKNYLLYKTAKSNDPGDVDPETIHMAHPAGGTQVSNVSSEAYVEDILEAHIQALNVALKPVKLSNASDILQAVKIVLAVDPTDAQKMEMHSKPLTQQLRDVYKEIIDLFVYCAKQGQNSLGVDAFNEVMKNCTEFLEKLKDPKTTYNDLNPRYKEIRDRLQYKIWGASLSSDETNNVLMPRLIPLENKFQATMWSSVVGKDPLIDTKSISKNNPDDQNEVLFTAESDRALKNLNKWQDDVNSDPELDQEDKDNASKWIKFKKDKITKLKDDFALILDPERKLSFSKKYLDSLRSITWKAPNDFETFRKNLGYTNAQ